MKTGTRVRDLGQNAGAGKSTPAFVTAREVRPASPQVDKSQSAELPLTGSGWQEGAVVVADRLLARGWASMATQQADQNAQYRLNDRLQVGRSNRFLILRRPNIEGLLMSATYASGDAPTATGGFRSVRALSAHKKGRAPDGYCIPVVGCPVDVCVLVLRTVQT
jgi:hypothetical protein